MRHHRLPYADAASLPEMAVDAHEVEHTMHLQRGGIAGRPAEPLGNLRPSGVAEPSSYEVSDDLARMADGLELHFD